MPREQRGRGGDPLWLFAHLPQFSLVAHGGEERQEGSRPRGLRHHRVIGRCLSSLVIASLFYSLPCSPKNDPRGEVE